VIRGTPFYKSVLLGAVLPPPTGVFLTWLVGYFMSGPIPAPAIPGNPLLNVAGSAIGAVSGFLFLTAVAFVVAGPPALVYSIGMSLFGLWSVNKTWNKFFSFVTAGAILGVMTSPYLIWSMSISSYAWKSEAAICCGTGALCGLILSNAWRTR
jgi:hypothetical protein